MSCTDLISVLRPQAVQSKYSDDFSRKRRNRDVAISTRRNDSASLLRNAFLRNRN